MYPAKFNLQHFMSTLAPGGFCFLHICVYVVYIFWVCFPSQTEAVLVALPNLSGSVVVVGFTLFAVMCYFVGVLLLLPPVDRVDRLAQERYLRRAWVPSKRKRFVKWYKASKSGWRKEKLIRLAFWKSVFFQIRMCVRSCWLAFVYWWKPRKSFRVEMKEAVQVPVEWYPSLVPLEIPQFPERKEGIILSQWIRGLAAKTLRENLPQEHGIDRLKSAQHLRFIMKWIRHVDRFPYPLWVAYVMQVDTIESRRKLFDKWMWDVLLETMRGSVSSSPPSKEPYNRCKMFVRASSEAQASEVYEREARTRMMNGFYYGLWIGARGAAVCTLLSAGLWITGFRGDESRFVSILSALSLLFSISFVFNTCANNWLVRFFHHLRRSECRALYNAYLLCRLCEQGQLADKESITGRRSLIGGVPM